MQLPHLKLNHVSSLVMLRAASLVGFIQWAASGMERWVEVRRDQRILLSMNDQQLKDIGISRGEAERAIRSGR